jgi:hypothetical protein
LYLVGAAATVFMSCGHWKEAGMKTVVEWRKDFTSSLCGADLMAGQTWIGRARLASASAVLKSRFK